MKKIAVIVSLVASLSMQAIDNDTSHKSRIAMTNPQTGEGYLSGMPTEMKTQIIMAISMAGTLQEAAKAIRALAVSNKELNQVINDLNVTKDLVHMLVAKFGGYHESVANALGTAGVKKYLAANEDLFYRWSAVENIEQVKELIARGADIHFSNNSGTTPLYVIITLGIINAGQTTDNKQTKDLVSYLTARGATVNSINAAGATLLIAALDAMIGGQVFDHCQLVAEVIQVLLKSGMTPEVLNAQQDGLTALHKAIQTHCDDIVKLLLQAGADVFIKSKNNKRENAVELARAELMQFKDDELESKKVKHIILLLEQAAKDQAAKKR